MLLFLDPFGALFFLKFLFALFDLPTEHDSLTFDSLLQTGYVDIVSILHTLFAELLDHLVIVPHVDQIFCWLDFILKYFLEFFKT